MTSGARRHAARNATAVLSTRRRVLRDATALAAGVLTFAGISAGLIQFAVPAQVGVLVGAAAGLLAAGWMDAGLIGVAAVVLGSVLSTKSMIIGTGPLAVTAVLAAAVGVGIAFWVRQTSSRMRTVVAAVCIGLILANYWASAIYRDFDHSSGQPTAVDYLSEVPPAGQALTDNLFYQRVMWLVDSGEGYYQAFRQAYNENARWQRDPDMVVSYRFPTLFWIWKALPAKPGSIVIGMILLGTLAVAAAVWLVSDRVHMAFAVPVAGVLAAYMLHPAVSNGMLYMEAWAVPFGLASVAATAASLADAPDRRWRVLLVTGVVLGVAATLIRETMGYIILAGLIGSVVAPREQRKVRLAGWGAGLLAVAVAFALHVLAIGGAVSHGQTASAWFNGGLRSLWLGLNWSTYFIAAAWVVPVCAMLALLGSATQRRRDRQVWALSLALLALGVLLLVSNEATGGIAAGATSINYWGMISAPLLIGLAGWAPSALGFRAGDRRKAGAAA